MKKFIKSLKNGHRWLVGIGTWLLYGASRALPYPVAQAAGIILALALGAFLFAISIWRYDPEYDGDAAGADSNGFSFKWSQILILMITVILVYSAIAERGEYSPRPSSSPAPQEQNQDLSLYIVAIKSDLSHDFSYVDVHSNGDTIEAKVANDGMSQSLYLLKNSANADDGQYREVVEGLQDFVTTTVAGIREAGRDNIHIELQLLDDIEQLNYANFGAAYPSALVEIYDGELRYDKMTDPAPESYIQPQLLTLGKQQALKSALSYLSHMAFSYDGLIEQLEYEGYSHEEAIYGADNCGADWDEQAALTAASYLSHMSFSRTGLIEQLEYEGFTHEQAVYGASAVGY